ncbi:MAG: hypothetical protein Q7K16_02090 [Candidatus Azambacteria bacterium]|nr:hypothetical protein [Candidatus Azambacteria bacterium]
MEDIVIIRQKVLKKELKYFRTTAESGKWFRLSLSEQLGNIGSEVARALNWRQKNAREHCEKALERAMELFYLTLSDPRWKYRAKEIARAREVINDFFYGDNQYKCDAADIDRYFMQFALAARINK